ncbi:MAG: DUF1553 domain-containing protein [Pirellula sp.]
MLPIVWILLNASTVGAWQANQVQGKVDFQTEIRPILSNRCFACHGPDENTVEAGLRLDSFDSAISKADSGRPAIVPGDVNESELLRRVSSQDDEVRMPPPHFGERLTARETELLQRWIASGAAYAKHWSYETPRLPAVEAQVSDWESRFPEWHGSVIDRLVLRKLAEKGWEPAPRANKATLLRRVTLDLTGLPPTLDEQMAFVNNPSPHAYEELVDRLLASPAYGEHWGRRWLDMARYADSAGYADDPPRTIWAYRDWVVRAFNSNMPFDQFTIEQLAGDLLPNPTPDQLVATAFHRNTLTNNEGGTNDEEFRNVAIVDRVNTTMAVWMGVTMACAQCHSHKYDPISQKEYFQVFAVLNQSEDADRGDESPTYAWFSPEQRNRREELQRDLERIEKQIDLADPGLIAEQREWEEKYKRPLDWLAVTPTSIQTKSGDPGTIQEQGLIQVDSKSENDTLTLDIPLPNGITAENLTGIRIESRPDATLPNQGAGKGDGNFVLTHVSASLFDPNAAKTSGQFIRIDLPGKDRILSLAEVQVFSGTENVAPHGKPTQSSEILGGAALRAIDGNTSGNWADNSTTHTAISEAPWWELDLGEMKVVDSIAVWNRTDSNLLDRLSGAKIALLDANRNEVWQTTLTKAAAENRWAMQTQSNWTPRIASSDYSQSGFPASNAIDSDPKSGWAVGGSVNMPHAIKIAGGIATSKNPPASVSPPTPSDQGSVPVGAENNAGNTLSAVGETAAKVEILRLRLGFDSPHKRLVLARFSVSLTTDSRAADMLAIPSEILNIVRSDMVDLTSEGGGPKNTAAENTTPEKTAQGKAAQEKAAQEKALLQDRLHQYYVRVITPTRAPMRHQRDKLRAELDGLKPVTTVPVLRELAKEKRRETRIQLRGNYRVTGESVEPGVPKVFLTGVSTPDNNLPMSRLELAQWLVSADNPLTARVIANRTWESLFGVGIVRTSEEFGSQGDLPTNQPLLDYLAIDMMRGGWDMKRLIRSIVLSSAYQQRSSVDPKRYEEDPENIYVSRGPRFRVAAEQVRDMALASAGLLSHRFYGPPTRPPQPSMGLSAAFGSRTDWETSQGEDRFRRAIYTQWRRSNPYPAMATFDAPSREVCVLKRDRTNTPLQALVTLNDPVFLEAAQGLARRVCIHELPNGSEEDRIGRLFYHALSRSPNEREMIAVKGLLAQAVQELSDQRDKATKLASEPIGPLPNGVDPVELAAWTTLCNVVLNLDEFLMTP